MANSSSPVSIDDTGSLLAELEKLGKKEGAIIASALLSVDQVSAYTGIAVGTLHAWRCRGCGPPWCKLGGKIVRYRLADVEAWIEGSKREPNEPKQSRRKLALPILGSRPKVDRKHRLGGHRTQ